jgi:hypothetical protein
MSCNLPEDQWIFDWHMSRLSPEWIEPEDPEDVAFWDDLFNVQRGEE